MNGQYAKERAEGGMVEAVEEVKRESNFPSYDNPGGTIPGQRKGFTPAELDKVEAVRAWRRQGVLLLHAIGGTDPASGQNGRLGGPDLTLALRHVQDAEYRAVRHITGGPKD